MTIGERLKRAMKSVGLTQEEVARRAGLEESTVSDIVKNKSHPRFDTVERIIGVIGLPFSVIFDEPHIHFSADDADLGHRFHTLLGRLLENDATQKQLGQGGRRNLPKRRRSAGDTIQEAPADELAEVELLPNEVIPEDYVRLMARRAYRVRTDSMIGAGILESAVVYVRPTGHLEAADGEIVVCQLNQRLYLKRLDLRGGQITLRSENPRYADMVMTGRDKLTLIGICVQPAAPAP